MEEEGWGRVEFRLGIVKEEKYGFGLWQDMCEFNGFEAGSNVKENERGRGSWLLVAVALKVGKLWWVHYIIYLFIYLFTYMGLLLFIYFR